MNIPADYLVALSLYPATASELHLLMHIISETWAVGRTAWWFSSRDMASAVQHSQGTILHSMRWMTGEPGTMYRYRECSGLLELPEPNEDRPRQMTVGRLGTPPRFIGPVRNWRHWNWEYSKGWNKRRVFARIKPFVKVVNPTKWLPDTEDIVREWVTFRRKLGADDESGVSGALWYSMCRAVQASINDGLHPHVVRAVIRWWAMTPGWQWMMADDDPVPLYRKNIHKAADAWRLARRVSVL